MNTSVNYQIISDAFAELQMGVQTLEVFPFTGDPQTARNIRAVLVWKANAVGASVSGLDYNVYLNGDLIHQDGISVAGGGKHSVHELFNATKITTGTNRVKFELLGGTGALKISDVYLLYQKDA